MRLGRLALKVYLYSVATGVATVLVFVLSFHLAVRNARHDPLTMQADHLIADLWERDHSPVDRTRDEGPFGEPEVTVYELSGAFVASTSPNPPPMISSSEVKKLEMGGAVQLRPGLVARPIREQGRLTGVGIVRLPPPGPPGPVGPLLVIPLVALALLFLAATFLFSRHIARPLEQLAKSAKAFGKGDRSARSRLQRKDEIGDLGRAFDDMAERVTHLMSAQQELLINVSHELLTPMSRIRIAVDLIAEGNAEQAHEMAEEITRDLLELEKLLDDVMTVAKFDLRDVDSGAALMPLRRAPLEIDGVVETAVSRFRAQHTTHPVIIEAASPLPSISADAVLLRRVLENLLENARKYSSPGTAIEIGLNPSETHLTVTVTDHGMGIEEGDLGQVFTPFFRGDRSRSRATGGVGLGLALASRVVRAHGGTIAIESKPGVGTKVSLHLPLSEHLQLGQK